MVKNAPQAERELDFAISHFIQAKSLPFSFALDILSNFNSMLVKAQSVNTN